MNSGPTRTPRAGDPFSGPPTRAEESPAPKPRRKKGRTFFLVLLSVGGVLVLASLILVFTGRDMLLEFYQDFVIPRGIPEALPPDYPVDQARELIATLNAYFEQVGKGPEADRVVLEMISRIETVMADKRITPEEAETLLAAARAGMREGE